MITQPNVAKAAQSRPAMAGEWKPICNRSDLVANSGVVAWLDGTQIALFHLPQTEEGEKLFALENRDPKSNANVIGRGIIGHLQGGLVIASPLYNSTFASRTVAASNTPSSNCVYGR